jgi:hypothetical protein
VLLVIETLAVEEGDVTEMDTEPEGAETVGGPSSITVTVHRVVSPTLSISCLQTTVVVVGRRLTGNWMSLEPEAWMSEPE